MLQSAAVLGHNGTRVIAELLVYLELLLFLAGALIYGFLTRELLRRPDVLPDNLPLRLALVCLTLFYGGTLADTVLFFMLDPAPAGLPGAAGTGLDLLRGVAWLVTLPLLLHALERIDARAPPAAAGGTERPSPLPGRVLVVAGYLALGLFVVPVARFAASGSIALADAARRWHPLLVALSALTLLPAAWLALGLARRVAERRLARFFRLLAGLMLGLLALVAAGLGLDPWNAGAQGLDRLLRTATLGALLLPGGLFVFYVQRYNLLRLSLSNRALRQFLTVLLVVLLVMLAGPAAGRELSEMRRFVAWGLTLALVVGLGSPLLSRWAERRSPRLRVLMGRGVTPGELDAFLDSVEGIDLEESAVLARAQERVGRWLGTRAAFLPDPEEDPETAPLWRHFRSGEEILVDRKSVV